MKARPRKPPEMILRYGLLVMAQDPEAQPIK
jgi:hypothetical protein